LILILLDLNVAEVFDTKLPLSLLGEELYYFVNLRVCDNDELPSVYCKDGSLIVIVSGTGTGFLFSAISFSSCYEALKSLI